eukprot:scaffold78276_cov65-Phaeocystis_antarctica.AAC.1
MQVLSEAGEEAAAAKAAEAASGMSTGALSLKTLEAHCRVHLAVRQKVRHGRSGGSQCECAGPLCEMYATSRVSGLRPEADFKPSRNARFSDAPRKRRK